jgi:glycosyltransferase involved in cell wall biosynthesis
MRIAVWHNLPSGGGKRALHSQLKGLLARGHEIEVWCPPTADRNYLPLRALVKEHVVPVEGEPRRSRNPLARAWGNYANVVKKLRAAERHSLTCARQIEQRGFDVLLAHADRDLLAPPIGRHTALPSVLYLQEPSRVLYEAMPVLPWAALPSPIRFSPGHAVRFLHNLIRVQGLRMLVREERESARRFGTLLVNSYFSMESVKRAYGLHSQVCYLGVDTALFHPQGRDRERTVISVGALTPAKGPETIIRAVGELGEPLPVLVWVGNAQVPEYRAEMEALARSLGVNFQLHMLVPDEELVALLNRASVLAYAPHLEPFGYAPLEAGACGLPTVAVTEGGVRETVRHGETGLLAERSPAAMAAALKRILDDPVYGRSLGEGARRDAEERWSLDGAIDRLEARLMEATQIQSRAT